MMEKPKQSFEVEGEHFNVPKEWLEKADACQEIRLQRLLNSTDDQMLEANEQIVGRGIELRKKYPDAESVLLFHILIGSTPPWERITKLDFWGDDSVEKFVKGL